MTGAASFQFYLFAVLAIVSALLCITRRAPVAAALWLVNVMFALSGLYVMLDAPFIGAIQVLVYAGAIMVVFIFVVMLLNLGRTGLSDLRGLTPRLIAGGVGCALLSAFLVIVRDRVPAPPAAPAAENVVLPVAEALFSEHLVAFELTSVILLVAVVGAVLLAKRRVSA